MSESWKQGPAVVWRGFEHRWLRRVLGFSTPHRISKLASYVDQRQQPAFHFAQATGVDGNYMRPIGHYGVVSAPEMLSCTRRLKMSFSDQIQGEPPRASSTIEQSIEIPTLAEHAGHWPVVAVLNGFSIRSRCEDQHQSQDCPCNSDGFWPSELGCELIQNGQSLRLVFSLERAWTPMLGGLPPFEIKALNRRLDYEVEVSVLFMAAPSLQNTQICSLRQTTTARAPKPASITLQDTPLGLTRWGFRLADHAKRGPRKHRGRYLDGLGFWLANDIGPTLNAQIHIPRTVVPTDVDLRLDALIAPNCQIETHSVRGKLCFNSTDQAPWFSRWKGCDNSDRGPACSEDRVLLKLDSNNR
ncbi:MAG TPA: hypothetical protein DCQ06_01710 [Myxococcales bacterium]|nr:hypothetical protein [Myxococcales bacterium]HAN30290.1 hypothetical protein [Myxococcales bacterium]